MKIKKDILLMRLLLSRSIPRSRSQPTLPLSLSLPLSPPLAMHLFLTLFLSASPAVSSISFSLSLSGYARSMFSLSVLADHSASSSADSSDLCQLSSMASILAKPLALLLPLSLSLPLSLLQRLCISSSHSLSSHVRSMLSLVSSISFLSASEQPFSLPLSFSLGRKAEGQPRGFPAVLPLGRTANRTHRTTDLLLLSAERASSHHPHVGIGLHAQQSRPQPLAWTPN